MRGQLLLVAGAATVAVCALSGLAAVAYASPLPTTSSAVADTPALVVPLNYHPSTFEALITEPSNSGLVGVLPQSAIDIGGSDATGSTPTAGSSASGPTGDADGSAVAGPTDPAPANSGGDGSSDDKSSTNNGNDVNNKGNGSNKNSSGKGSSSNSGSSSNDGNDLKNKGSGANKGKGKSDG